MNQVNQAYKLIEKYFKNTQVLSLEELYYLMQIQPNQEINNWYHDFISLDYLNRIPNDAVEVFINQQQYIQTFTGEVLGLTTHLEDEHWQLHSEIICYKHQQKWNYSAPFTSFFLETDKKSFRATFIHHSLSPRKQSSFFFRTISQKRFPVTDFTLEHNQTELLTLLVNNKSNILIAGATGSGKTSFLSSLLNDIPQSDHLVLLEDTKEILPTVNTTELIAENKQGKDLKSLCEYSLRMSPDRLIIGEMRGAEVIPFFLMMNTGHRGLLSTIHANSAIEAVHRCAFLFSMYSGKNSLDINGSLKMISQNIDYVVYLKDKKISQIIKILGSEKQNCFYEEVRSELTRDLFV